MSDDIFTDPTLAPSRKTRHGSPVHHGFGISNASKMAPMDPEMQSLVDARNLAGRTEQVRKEAKMDTPENRQKAFEAKMAEREQKRIHFHFGRAQPRFIEEGWKQLRADFTDEEIRVYTIDNERRKFWGIKPTGIGMFDFWDQIDPEVRRYHDTIAVTWADPLVPPPVSLWERGPVVWAGQGPDPDSTLPVPLAEPVPPLTQTAVKSKKRQRTPEVNPTHRVRKSATESPKVNKSTRVSLADKVSAGELGVDNRMRRVPKALHPNGRPIRNRASDPEQVLAIEDGGLAPTKRPRGRPATKTKPVANDIKRPRGRPPAKGKQIENPPKQAKAPTVKGNARVTKSQKANSRPSAPSTHEMRTRGKGPAELLRLP